MRRQSRRGAEGRAWSDGGGALALVNAKVEMEHSPGGPAACQRAHNRAWRTGGHGAHEDGAEGGVHKDGMCKD